MTWEQVREGEEAARLGVEGVRVKGQHKEVIWGIRVWQGIVREEEGAVGQGWWGFRA